MTPNGETVPSVPCGALVVTRWIEGNEAEVRWCERTSGPCPFPGADHSSRSLRACAATAEVT